MAPQQAAIADSGDADTSDQIPLLDNRRLKWIFDEGQSHFAAEIERLETELIRHKSLVGPVRRKQLKPTTREERIKEIERWLAEYAEIVDFCQIVRDRLVNEAAEQFAAMWAASFRKRNAIDVPSTKTRERKKKQ